MTTKYSKSSDSYTIKVNPETFNLIRRSIINYSATGADFFLHQQLEQELYEAYEERMNTGPLK